MTARDTSKAGTHGITPALADQAVELRLLDPHPLNARRRDARAEAALRQSLEVNGQYRAIVARRVGRGKRIQILAGHGTVEQARALGWTHVAATVHQRMDDDAAARIVAVDNRTSDLAGYDEEGLLELLGSLPDLEGTGYDLAELEELRRLAAPTVALTDPDDAPDRPVAHPVTKDGDVWLLGSHRLACGDATSERVLASAMGGGVADMVFTDPPYGVAYKGGSGLTIANDDLGAADLGALLHGAFTRAWEALRPGGAFYVCSPSGRLETTFRLALDGCNLELRQQIVWVKDRFVLGRADYHGRHETILFGWRLEGEPVAPPLFDPVHDTILYGWKDGAAHTWEGGRKQDTVWEVARPARSAIHPTMKPVALVARAVENSSQVGGTVLDLFAGSGSTLIACHGTGRLARLIELDPAYCDVICRRWHEHTGVAPVLERTGKPVPFAEVAA